MDEKRLTEIEEWANDHALRCYGCDGIARVIVPGTSRPLCTTCAPNVPGAVLPLAPLVSVYATTLDLVAAVRRLTAALDAVTAERGEFLRSRDLADEYIARLRAQHAAALATARREGAEEARERCDDALDSLERHYRATERDVKAHAVERGAAWERGAAIENARAAIRALPLDAPGGGS